MVYRDIEESLNLSCVQIHGHYTGRTGCRHQVSDQLGGNRFTAASLAVLTCIAIVRYYTGDMTGRCSLQCVNHDEHFHQIVINRCTGRLNDEAVFAADTFIDHHLNFTIVEFAADGFSKRNSDVVGNFLCQCGVRIPCKNFQFRSVFHVHFAASPFPFISLKVVKCIFCRRSVTPFCPGRHIASILYQSFAKMPKKV